MSNESDATTTGAAPVLQDVASVGGMSDVGTGATTAYIEYVAVFKGGIVS